MVSKESDFLIHLAEEQLERLNKSLYFYQRNAKMYGNLIDFSDSCIPRESSNLSYTPIHDINDEEPTRTPPRDEYQFSSDISPKREKENRQSNSSHVFSHSIVANDNHIRDWRSMAKLAQKTLGPNKHSSHKFHFNQPLPIAHNRKEKLSTFWDYNGHRRIMKMSKSSGDIAKTDHETNKCTCRRNGYSKKEIRKYIREKQRLYKEMQNETGTNTSTNHENVRSSLVKLNNGDHKDCRMIQVEHCDHFYDDRDKKRRSIGRGSTSSDRKSSKNEPIYDELRKDGIFDYQAPRKKGSPVFPQSFKPNNFLNNAVDSGFETGEWLKFLFPKEKKTPKNPRYSTMSKYLPNSAREYMYPETPKQKSPPSKKDHREKLNKHYQDHISAYDAGSENDNELELTPLTSPVSFQVSDDRQSHNFVREKMDVEHNGESSVAVKKSSLFDSKLSINLPVCNVDISFESSHKVSQELRNTESSQVCLVEELKDALLEAQRQLNPEFFEPAITLSERISRAVENFIKTKDRKTELPDIGPQSLRTYDNVEPSIVVKPKSESCLKLNESKRDHLSTEYEATEIEHEKCKKFDPPAVMIPEIKEVIEEKSSFSICSDPSEGIENVLKEHITKKKELEFRREKANELIKLTQEFNKESKRVKLLEKKAYKFSKHCLQDTKLDLKSIGLAKFSRQTIPPDGKDSGRSEMLDNIKNHLSPKMGDPDSDVKMAKKETIPIGNSLPNHSDLSEVDEPTVSISEFSTTLTDHSDLEAQLVALRAEMTKKHQLVATLKLRQKEIKRDNIKQKEVTLQKQIEMYDNYISKLQSNIDELNTKENDGISEVSRTLTASTATINDLHSQIEEECNVLPLVSVAISGNEYKELSIDEIYDKCCKICFEIQTESFDRVVENNVRFAGEDLDLDLMDSMKHDIQILDNIPKEILEGDKNDSSIKYVGYGGDMICKDDSRKDDIKEDDFEEMVKINSSSDDLIKDDDIEDLYLKESNKSEDDLILDELISKNAPSSSSNTFLSNQTDLKELSVVETKSENQCHNERKDIAKEGSKDTKPEDSSTEIFIIEENNSKVSTQGILLPSLESDSTVMNDVDGTIPSVPRMQITGNGDFDEIEDENLKFPVSCSEDDGSSTSEVKCFNDNVSEECQVVPQSIDDVQDLSKEAIPISTPVLMYQTEVASQKPTTHVQTIQDLQKELLNSAKVEQLVDYLLNEILCSEIEEVKVQNAKVNIEKKPMSSVIEVFDYECNSYMEPEIITLPPINEEISHCSKISRPDDLWEFTDVGGDEPPEMLNSLLLPYDNSQEVLSNAQNVDALSAIDKELLKEKIKWLIPLDSKHLEEHSNAAINHFFKARGNKELLIEDSLRIASESLPELFAESMSIVTEADVDSALFDSSKQHCFIDKRIIIQLVKEVFSEIYSVERYLPQKPWIHSSIMIQRNNYTTWKGDKPPESYDLVTEIVRERICQIFNQNNIVFKNTTIKKKDNTSHSKITKWCMERQKDQIDKLLINDLRTEENEWIYYDKSEEDVKIQIAEDIFQCLITDTTSWMRSTLSQN